MGDIRKCLHVIVGSGTFRTSVGSNAQAVLEPSLLGFLNVMQVGKDHGEFLLWCKINAQDWQVTKTFMTCSIMQEGPIFWSHACTRFAFTTLGSPAPMWAFWIFLGRNLGLMMSWDSWQFSSSTSPLNGVLVTCHKFYLCTIRWRNQSMYAWVPL